MSVHQSAMRTMPPPKWGVTNQTTDESQKQGDSESQPVLKPDELLPSSDVKPVDMLVASGLMESKSESNKYKVETDYSEKDDELLAAQAEWDAVETVIPDLPGQKKIDTGQSENVHRSPIVSFSEVLQYFQTSNLDNYKSQIKTSVQRSGFSSFVHFCFGPPKLHKDLHEERNILFCVAQCNFDNQQPMHLRVLQTIYKRLTGSKFDCQRYGSHWDQIGFQGNDPATDLRGTGFLALMNLLYFVTDPKTLPLARDIYKLSLHQTQNFPFSVMGINITRIAIQTLREDNMNKLCNTRSQVFGVFNDFYVGTYLHLYLIWKQQHKTIADSGFVIKDVETFCKKNPQKVIQNLEKYLTEKHNAPLGPTPDSPGKNGTEKGLMNFSGIADLDPS